MFEVEKVVSNIGTFYYIKGTRTLHREDGPARKWYDGEKRWYINGRLHRVDGPAIIYNNGEVEWHLDGVRFETKEEWFEDLTEEQKVKTLYSESFIRG
jgi:hypothetical protein